MISECLIMDDSYTDTIFEFSDDLAPHVTPLIGGTVGGTIVSPPTGSDHTQSR